MEAGHANHQKSEFSARLCPGHRGPPASLRYLFNAQLAAQEKRDSVRPSRRALPREVQDPWEKEARLLTRERLGEASAARVHLPTAGWQLPGVQAWPCPVGNS
ncbi:hypothetical protein TcYC6_0078680 [Trypanosoma cruzi]|nr:hypothetical protein TcYC6_0078680 [Trypanosoma cruzi]